MVAIAMIFAPNVLGHQNDPVDVLKHHKKIMSIHAPTDMKIHDPRHVWGGGMGGGSNIEPVCNCQCACDYQISMMGEPACNCKCDCHPPNVPSEMSVPVPVPTGKLPPFDMPAASPAVAPAVANLPTMRHPHRRPPFDFPSFLPTASSEQPSETTPTTNEPVPTTVTTSPPKPEPAPTKQSPPDKPAPPSKPAAPTTR